MSVLSKTAFAALLLGSTIAAPVLAASPDAAGCPPGMHRAESEGGGIGTTNLQTRKAESEGGGIGTTNLQTRKAESEGGGIGTTNLQTRKAESEGGGIGTTNLQTRKAEAEAVAPCVR